MANLYLNWPSASAMDHRIDLSAQVNGLPGTRLSDTGKTFLKFGKRYGINPAIAIAIAQRECQCAADGSELPRNNNFGGITDPYGSVGTCGNFWFGDRMWARFCTVEDGIEGIFKTLNKPIYRQSGNTLEAIMAHYSPPFENNWDDLWNIFFNVGKQLGVTINRTTRVYYTPSLKQRVRNRFQRS